jgi:hypothetical protein
LGSSSPSRLLQLCSPPRCRKCALRAAAKARGLVAFSGSILLRAAANALSALQQMHVVSILLSSLGSQAGFSQSLPQTLWALKGARLLLGSSSSPRLLTLRSPPRCCKCALRAAAKARGLLASGRLGCWSPPVSSVFSARFVLQCSLCLHALFGSRVVWFSS